MADVVRKVQNFSAPLTRSCSQGCHESVIPILLSHVGHTFSFTLHPQVLPVLDNFERAAQSLQAVTPGGAAVTEMYNEVRVKLEEVLKQYGVEEMECVGQPFDPLVHEAIVSEYSSEVRVRS